MTERSRVWWAFVVALLVLVLALVFGWWRSARKIPPPPDVAWTLSALAPEPDWHAIASAKNVSHSEFTAALENVYGFERSWESTITVFPTHAEIISAVAAPERTRIKLEFNQGSRPPNFLPRYWRPAGSAQPPRPDAPLKAVRIAIDPGHIGGAWSQIEQRWYRRPDRRTEVKEGELTLRTARVLKTALEKLGAAVTLVRDRPEPVTSRRPADFAASGLSEAEAELRFYRQAEIRARADLVNTRIKPDLVICLHFNAEPWGNPNSAQFVSVNHLHLIVNGHYSAEELSYDDVRSDMLRRLLQGIHHEEIKLADAISKSMAEATRLPAYDYHDGHMTGSAHRVLPDNPYVWARNLLANRIYLCPVVYCEPYVMNSREVYERVAAGDYEGEKLVAGSLRQSIFREYAAGVAEGLRTHYLSSKGQR